MDADLVAVDAADRLDRRGPLRRPNWIALHQHRGRQRDVLVDAVGIDALGQNLYAYVNDNPLRFIDKTGHEGLEPIPMDDGWYFGFFVQDDIRIHPRLTLNLGLRYDLQLPITDKFNRLLTFVPGVASRVSPLAPVGMLFPGDAGIGRGIISADKNNLTPRVGLAWDPFGNGKTAIRGAAGIYYDIGNLGAMLFNGGCCQPPLDFFNTINNPYPSVAAMTAAGLPRFQIGLPIAYGSAPRTPSLLCRSPTPKAGRNYRSCR